MAVTYHLLSSATIWRHQFPEAVERWLRIRAKTRSPAEQLLPWYMSGSFHVLKWVFGDRSDVLPHGDGQIVTG
jgi:hypothetical protein